MKGNKKRKWGLSVFASHFVTAAAHGLKSIWSAKVWNKVLTRTKMSALEKDFLNLTLKELTACMVKMTSLVSTFQERDKIKWFSVHRFMNTRNTSRLTNNVHFQYPVRRILKVPIVKKKKSKSVQIFSYKVVIAFLLFICYGEMKNALSIRSMFKNFRHSTLNLFIHHSDLFRL